MFYLVNYLQVCLISIKTENWLGKICINKTNWHSLKFQTFNFTIINNSILLFINLIQTWNWKLLFTLNNRSNRDNDLTYTCLLKHNSLTLPSKHEGRKVFHKKLFCGKLKITPISAIQYPSNILNMRINNKCQPSLRMYPNK